MAALPKSLDYQALCNANATELAGILRTTLQHRSEDTITAEILAAIDNECLPPAVAVIWLSLVKSLPAMVACLNSASRRARFAALKALRKYLRRNDWQPVWQALGGVPGLLQYYRQSSIREATALTNTFACGLSPQTATQERQEAFDQLFKSLIPEWFPESKHKSQDPRDTLSVVIGMLCLCSDPLVLDVLRILKERKVKFNKEPINRRVIRHHLTMFRDEVQKVCRGDDANLLYSSHYTMSYLVENVPEQPSLTRHGWSQSMDFMFDCLEFLKGRDISSKTASSSYYQELIVPLAGRALRHHATLDDEKEMLDLCLAVLARHIGDWSGNIRYQTDSFLGIVLRFWRRDPDNFETCLIQTFQLFEKWKLSSWQSPLPYYCAPLLARVPDELRTRLFRQLCSHMVSPGFDDTTEPAALAHVSKKEWTLSVFLLIDRYLAATLLDKLRYSDPRNFKIKVPGSTHATILKYKFERDSDDIDLALLSIYLRTGRDDWHVEAIEGSDKLRRLASQSRDEQDRTYYATGAMFYSVASLDLAHVKKTVEWSKRYIRDSLTASVIFGSTILNTTQVISLLSGDPPAGVHYSGEDLRKNVLVADEILLLYLEIAVLATREPSFNSSNWYAVRQLFKDVTFRRLQVSESLQIRLKLSDEQLYDILWSDTLETLIKAETILLNPQTAEKLGQLGLGGLLGTGTTWEPQTKAIAAYKFLDNLAEARNTIWTKHRIQETPDIDDLPPPWPKGLPVEKLLPVSITGNKRSDEHLKYVALRAAAIVFLPPEQATSRYKEEEGRKLALVEEDYIWALTFHIFSAPSLEEKSQRAAAAWKHACKQFNGDQWSPVEAIRFWQPVFDSAIGIDSYSLLPPLYEHSDKRKDDYSVTLPEDAALDSPNEWNPAENLPEQIEGSEKQTIFVFNHFAGRIFSLPGYCPPQIWNVSRLSTRSERSGKILEALTVSALIFLNDKVGGLQPLLPEAFPKETPKKRIPPLFLADEFLAYLDRTPRPVDAALNLLQQFMSRPPPALIHRVVENAWTALGTIERGKPQYVLTESIFFNLLKLLIRGDKLSLSTAFVMRAIIYLPDSSSWFRQICNIGFLNSLPPAEAEKFLLDFASEISLSQKPKVTAIDGAGTSPKKPLVKVTAVKMFASFLTRADIVPYKRAMSMLEDLFTQRLHVDVREAAMTSYMSLTSQILRKGTPDTNSIQSRVRESLAKLKEDICGFSERDLLDASSYRRMLDAGEFPEIYRETPLADGLLANIRSWRSSKELDFLKDFILQEVIFPAIDESISLHKVWHETFVRKYKLDVDISKLPILSIHPKVMLTALAYDASKMPLRFTQIVHKYLLTLVALPRGMVKANEKLQSDSKLSKLDEVKHWLSIWDVQFPGPNDLRMDDIFDASSVPKRSEANSAGVATKEYLQQCTCEQGRVIVHLKQSNLLLYEQFFSRRLSRPSYWQRTQDYEEKVVVLKQLIGYIEGELDECRRQNRYVRLPPTWPLRLRLLRFPQQRTGTTEANVRALGDDIVNLLGSLLRETPAYVRKFEQLVTELHGLEMADNIPLALHLGQLSASFEQEQSLLGVLLRLSIAAKLLEKSLLSHDFKAKQEQVQEMTSPWTQHPMEEIRELGWYMQRKLDVAKDAAGNSSTEHDSLVYASPYLTAFQ